MKKTVNALTVKTILSEYEDSIRKGKALADSIFPDVKYIINDFRIGNTGMYGGPDGERLGLYTPRPTGFCDITLSESILSKAWPFKNMEEEITSTIVHEYAHASFTVYAYKSDPIKMYLSLIFNNQRKIEREYIDQLWSKYKDSDFEKYVISIREGEDPTSELISEALQSVCRRDEHEDEAKVICEDYKEIIDKEIAVPISVFIAMCKIKPLLMPILLICFGLSQFWYLSAI